MWYPKYILFLVLSIPTFPPIVSSIHLPDQPRFTCPYFLVLCPNYSLQL